MENAERIELELDRNIQVLQPSQAEKRTQLPDDFFRYSPDELKKEHLARYINTFYVFGIVLMKRVVFSIKFTIKKFISN